MTLPEVCPLDENQKCRERECHLFCLEWRTREPTCLIGYSTTSKVRSWKDDSKQDTYATETFKKLGKQSASKKKSVSGKGDWIPRRLAEKQEEEPAQRKVEKAFQKPFARNHAPWPEINNGVRQNERHAESVRLNEKYTENEAEKASLRLESRLKKESAEEKPIIYAKTQPKIQEKPKVSERIVSSNKQTTIFASSNEYEKKDYHPQGREEDIKRIPDDKEKRRKLDKVMEIDTPEVHDEEFWS
jgi:hypothetical protein